MSIAALYELQERLYNCAVAGTNMIGEDFRLQRAIEQFEQSAGAAPIFKKIAEQVNQLRESKSTSTATALLDALALIDAVLYTQGATEVAGERKELPDKAIGCDYVEARYSQLHGLKQALTEKGSGRYEVVKTAFDAKMPALSDFRLRRALITGLGDNFAEMADLVVDILASGDRSVIPLLKEGFDPKGKREMARRVEVIQRLAKESENSFYLSLIDGSSAAVRNAAIHALQYDSSNAVLLMELAEKEKGDAREAAYSSLYALQDVDNRDFWLSHAKQRPGEVCGYLFGDTGDDVSDLIADSLQELLASVLSVPASESKVLEIEQKNKEILDHFMFMSTNKSSDKLVEVFKQMGARKKQLSTAKEKKSGDILNLGRGYKRDLIREVNFVLAGGMVLQKNDQIVSMATNLYETCGLPYLHAGFCAALLSRPAAEVFEQFSPFLYKAETAEILVAALMYVVYRNEKEAYRFHGSNYDGGLRFKHDEGIPLYEELDPRWIELLVNPAVRGAAKYKLLSEQLRYTISGFTLDQGREHYDVMLMGLMNVNDPVTSELLKEHFLLGAKDLYSEIPLIALRRLGETDLLDYITGLFQHKKYQAYNLQYLCKQLQLSLEETIAVLERLLQLTEQKQLQSRYYTSARLESTIKRMQSGEMPDYW